MSVDELVARLRNAWKHSEVLCIEAADALLAERDRADKAEREREADHADQLAAMAIVSREHMDAVAKWLSAEARLAKAVEALRAIRRHVDSPAHYDAHIDAICEATLSEIEAGTVEHPDSGTQECCGLFIFSDGEQVCCGEPVVRAPVEHPNSAGANND